MRDRHDRVGARSAESIAASGRDDRSAIFTIGHSTRTIPEFADLLRVGGVETVVDIRSIPRSRTNPQFNIDVLPATLVAWRIEYTHIVELGGLRKKSTALPPEVNAFWTNQSFHNYADHALSHEFSSGLRELTALTANHRCAVMCSEAVWWRCHRRIVADYLLNEGKIVFHLMGTTRADVATMTRGAVPVGAGITYPARVF